MATIETSGQPPAPPDGRAGSTRGKEFVNRFGLPTASALVIGSIIGTGVFALPSALAPYGPSSLLAFGLVTIGALALAQVFGWLNQRVPGSGGPYLYARDAFGDFGGFITSWSYWLTAWIGNAAIVVAWVGYVEVFVNKGGNKWGAVAIALVGLWIPAMINISGRSQPRRLPEPHDGPQVRAARVHGDDRPAVHPRAQLRSVQRRAVARCGGPSPPPPRIALFSYLGLEVASVVAGRVRDPEAQRHPRDDARHGRLRVRLHPRHADRVRHGQPPRPARLDGAVLRLGQRDVRRRVGRQADGGGRDHLRHRLPQRLDADLRGDADGRGPRPACSRGSSRSSATARSRCSGSSCRPRRRRCS